MIQQVWIFSFKEQECSRSYFRTLVGYVLVLSLLILDALLKFRNRHNFSLTLGHHLPCPQTILRLKKITFLGISELFEAFSLDRQNKAIYFTVSPFPTNLKFLICEKGGGIVFFSIMYVHFSKSMCMERDPKLSTTAPLPRCNMPAWKLTI